MKKGFCIMLAAVIALAAGCALADQQVNLPNSRYAVTMPDGMAYDGSTPGTDEAFAYVSGELGLEVSFHYYSAPGANLASLLPGIQEKDPDDVQMTTVGGMPMIVYRLSDNGGKCIAYILQDGNTIHEIVFWYTTQKGADLSRTIMESIR